VPLKQCLYFGGFIVNHRWRCWNDFFHLLCVKRKGIV
jgi:hypothetical protein